MRLRSWGPLCAICCLCIASTCPTSDPYPPDPMRAPAFTAFNLTGIKINGFYQPAVHLQWDLRGKDSLAVGQFIILRKRESRDSLFDILHYNIPNTQYEDWDDRLFQEKLPGQGVYDKIWYRVFALDADGRSGDTSATDSIQLSWPPTIISPVDTLFDGLFKWSTILYRGGYYTYLSLWSDSLGLVWTSQPSEPIYGHETPDFESITLPSPPAPLAPGKYYCGVKVEIPGENIQSMTLRQFYAQ